MCEKCSDSIHLDHFFYFFIIHKVIPFLVVVFKGIFVYFCICSSIKGIEFLFYDIDVSLIGVIRVLLPTFTL